MTFFPRLSGPSCFSRLILHGLPLKVPIQAASCACIPVCMCVNTQTHTHSQSHFTLQQQRTIHAFQEHCLCIFINGFFFYVKAQFIQLPCSATTIVILTQVLSLTPTPWKFSLTCLPQELLGFLPLCSGIQTQLPENRLYQWMVNNSVHCIQYDHQFPNISFLLDRKLSKNGGLMLVVCISQFAPQYLASSKCSKNV